jgi:hypothetical protein
MEKRLFEENKDNIKKINNWQFNSHEQHFETKRIEDRVSLLVQISIENFKKSLK